MKFAATCAASLLSITLLAQEKVIRLYDGPAPGSETWTHEEKENNQNSWQTRVGIGIPQRWALPGLDQSQEVSRTPRVGQGRLIMADLTSGPKERRKEKPMR
ncbi:MAG: hypothetical protein AB9869_17945 [Verrucomicrobiia bacterium]